MIGVAQTPWCLSVVARLALHVSDTDLRFDSLHGFWMHSLEMRGIEGSIGGHQIQVDTVRGHISVRNLLTGHFHLRRIEMISPGIYIGGSTSEESMDEDDRSPINFPRVDAIYIQGGSLQTSDQRIEVSGIHVQGSLSSDTAQLDTLAANFIWQEEVFRLFTTARIQTHRGLFQVDTLSLDGPESHIFAHGYIGSQTDLNIIADPISADLLGPWLPNIEDSLMLYADLQGIGDSLHVVSDGSFVRGGTLHLRGSIRMDTPFVYLDTLNFKDFNLAYLSSDLTGELTGSIFGHVDGESWDSLDGRVNVNLMEGNFADIPIRSASLTGSMEQGAMQIHIDSDLALGSIEMAGAVHPVSSSGQLSGRFIDFNTQVLIPQHESAISGNFGVEWGDSLRGYVEFLPGKLGNMEINGGELQLYSKEDMVQLFAAIHADTTRIILEAGWRESGITGRLEVNALDIGALMNQGNGNSQINLIAESTTNWPPDSILVQVEIQPSSWGQIPVQESDIELVLQGLNLDVKGQMGFSSGNTAVHGSINFESSPPVWVLNQGQIENLDLRDLGIDIQTDLSAQMQFSGRGFENIQGEVIMDSSRINHESVPGGLTSISMSDGRVVMESQLMFGAGRLEARTVADPFAVFPTIEVTEAEFEQIDLKSLLGMQSFPTRLTGRIDSLYWGDIGYYATLTIDSGTVNTLEISKARINVEALGDTLSIHGAVNLGNGCLRLDHMQIGPDWEVVARGALKNLPMHDLGFLNADLNGSFHVDFKGINPQTMRVNHAWIVADSSRIGNLQFDQVRVAGTMDAGYIRLNQFEISSDAGQIRGEGSVSIFEESADSLLLTGSITNPGFLADWTGDVPISGAGTETLWALLTHQRDSLRWASGFTMQPMTWKSIRLFQASGYAEGTMQDFKPRIGKGELILDRISVPNLSARYARLEIMERQGKIHYKTRLGVDDRRSLYLDGDVDLMARQITLKNLDMYLGEDEWHLGVPTEILANDGFRIRYFVLESEDQEMTIDGIVHLDGDQRLGVNLYNVQISPFTDLLGYPSLGGIANVDLFFHGPANSPYLTGSLNLTMDTDNREVGSVAAWIDYRENGLDMEAKFTHVDQSTLSMAGLLPLDLRLKKEQTVSFPEASLTLQANKFNLAWINPFLPQNEINSLQGTLTADIDIAGSRTTPTLTGNLRLSDGYAHLPQLGIRPADFEMYAVMSQDTVYVERISAASGLGNMGGSGYLALIGPDSGVVDISLNLNDFRVVNTAPYVAGVSGALTVGGTLQRPDLTGHIEMSSAVIRPQDVPVTLADGALDFTEVDLQMLEQYFNIRASMWDTTTYSLVDALAMDLTVGIPGTVRLHNLQNPEMNVLLSGAVALSKAPYAEQNLQGAVNIVPELSYLRQFGRRFDIRRGRVTFAGSATNPFFDLQAALDIPSRSGQDTPVTILMDASGQLQDPKSLALELRSEPVQLDRADMISYMATGRPAADAFQLGGGGALQSGSDLALQQLSSFVAGAAGAGLGLDVVQIDPETGGGVTLTAGKYISRKLFASVKWPITEEQVTSSNVVGNNRELVIEYALYPWLVARMLGESGAVGLSLLYQYTW